MTIRRRMTIWIAMIMALFALNAVPFPPGVEVSAVHVTGVSALLIVALGYSMRRHLSNRLRKLRQFADSAVAGNCDQTIGGADEVAELGQVINVLATELRVSRQALILACEKQSESLQHSQECQARMEE